MDSLLTFIVLLIASAAATLLKKRAQRNAEREMIGKGPNTLRPVNQPGQSPPAPQRPKPESITWQGELRRMLEGEFQLGPPSALPPLAKPFEPPRPVAAAAPPSPLVAKMPATDPMGSLP